MIRELVKEKIRGIYCITCEEIDNRSALEQSKAFIDAGVSVIQYREKNKDYSSQKADCIEIQKICKRKGVMFLINDNVKLAAELSADGIHIGQDDMSVNEAREIIGNDKVIGLTINTKQQLLESDSLDIDYIGVGPIFQSTTKTDSETTGINLLAESVEKNIPVVAIGGINERNIKLIQKYDPESICMISDLLTTESITERIIHIKNKFNL